jgi:glycosyltransferase involved in cell wall biosynthesis
LVVATVAPIVSPALQGLASQDHPGGGLEHLPRKNPNYLNPRFSVVVVTYRRPEQLQLALEGLKKQQNAPPHEAVIVDNDQESTGRVVAEPFLAGQVPWRYEVMFRNNVSLARNVGAGLASGEWLAFLDDDCVPDPSWLATAETIIAAHPGPGLVFGGGYLDSNDQAGPLKLLSKDQYLVEGNIFFMRSEYLALGGMRPELGPSDGRFGYHEGSELQNRHLQMFGDRHRRVLVPRMAVRHLQANPHNRSYLALLAGYDGVRAFPQPRRSFVGWGYQFVKVFGPLVRLSSSAWWTSSGKLRKERRERDLYRLGETLGEIFQGQSLFFRTFSQKLRRLNNRQVGLARPVRGKTRSPSPSPAPTIPAPGAAGWMAGKVGTTELQALEFSDRWMQPFWPPSAGWKRPMRRLHIDSGVFPESRAQFQEFLKTYLDALWQLDVVCLWQTDSYLRDYEEALVRTACPRAVQAALNFLSLEILAPIAGWRWLVISPFVETMRRQVSRLCLVHAGRPWAAGLAGAEKRCEFLACPTFSNLAPSPFRSWSEGLEKLAMEAQTRKFDVALIGAGAWSLPLAARLKQAGRVAIHLGGDTQLCFGIKGQRWEGYGIYNEHWVRPSAAETPKNFLLKENGCYW